MSDKKAAPRFKETVIKDGLTHAGKSRAVGEVIEVTETPREFLRKREFIAEHSKPAKPAGKE